MTDLHDQAFARVAAFWDLSEEEQRSLAGSREDVVEACKLAVALVGDAAQAWVRCPNKAFDNRTALNMMQNDMDRVLQYLKSNMAMPYS